MIMAFIVSLLSALFVSGGIGLLTTRPNYTVFWAILPLFLIGVLGLFLILCWRLRFSNREWKFRTSDEKTVWHRYFVNGEPILWRSKNQEEDMFYEVDIGRERSIVAISFDCGDTCEAPIKSRFWFFREGGGHSFPEDSRHPYIEKEGDNPTELRLEQAIRAQRINMQIIKPDIEQPWRIEAVYVRIKTLFGLEYTIGKCRFDTC